MDRRHFLACGGAAGLTPLATTAWAAEGTTPAAGLRQLIELQTYQLESPEQTKQFDKFMAEAAIPALNRQGVKPVGVFYPLEGAGLGYVVLPHPSLESVVSVLPKLLKDEAFLAAGGRFLDAPAAEPAFKRLESSLLLAFRGMPTVETPAKGPDRVFQLRIYESPSVKTGQKKIEMFNDAGELTVFRRVGLAPVFFGETLIGAKMPNLTYMLGFNNLDEKNAAWKSFGADPDWKRLRAMPEYKDETILMKNGITNLMLKPSSASQI